MGHSAEEKIKILYEDSLADIRELTARMESMTATVLTAAQIVKDGKGILREQNEKLLIDRVTEITNAVRSLNSNEVALSIAATTAAQKLLSTPVGQLECLVRQQKEALGWINRAASFYGRPIPVIVAGLIGGMASGIVIKFF